jgi:RNA polymerase sigma-54 factor
MTPQLQQAIKLLQLSRLELQQTLSQHLMENPLLEDATSDAEEGESLGAEEEGGEKKESPAEGEGGGEGAEGSVSEFSEPLSSEEWDNYYEPDWRSGSSAQASGEDDFPSYEQTLAKATTLEDHLLWQLRLSSLEGHERSIGMMLIGNLDERGYLRASLEEMAKDAGVGIDVVESVLFYIQTFDPPGVMARDLQECLLIQIRHLNGNPIGDRDVRISENQGSLTEKIIKHHLPDLQKKRYANVAKNLGVSLEEVVESVHIIEGLEPKPGRPYFAGHNQNIIPDVFVFKDEGEWVVQLNEEGLPRVRISPYYKKMMVKGEKEGESAKSYLEDKLRGAQWIMRSIDQRNKTIVKVVRSLVIFQEKFLEKGIQYLKPLVLKQVAEDVGMHESTISRVTTNKYMYCPQGMLELKYFFNAGIQRGDPGGEELSSLTVREIIREMVAQEDPKKPLKDQDIVARLRNRDIVIARRTVAKYRAELNIAPANQRKNSI